MRDRRKSLGSLLGRSRGSAVSVRWKGQVLIALGRLPARWVKDQGELDTIGSSMETRQALQKFSALNDFVL